MHRALGICRWPYVVIQYLEHPPPGLLRTRAVVEGLPYAVGGYCMHGAPYRKMTCIWTNVEWPPMLFDLSHLVDGQHAETTQRGGRGGWDGGNQFTLDELHKLPTALCDELFRVSQIVRMILDELGSHNSGP